MNAEQFGRYRLDQLIGRGGMGEVYRAYDTERGRMVALKRLPKHLAQDAEFQARFRKESALAARLSEPHIIPIHDFGEIDGQLFIDMRLVTGRDLSTVLAAEGPLEPHRAAAVVAQVASALDAAHADGLVHRDVKPSNVMLTGERGREFVYLADFGIARTVGASGDTSLTATGATIGTMAYMAPERFAEGGGDHRIDVYSLGCMLFELLTGHKPFRDDGIPSLLHAHLTAEPPRPSRERPAVPPAVDEVVARAMAKKPDDRYPSAGALADALTAAVRGSGSTAGMPPHDPGPTMGAYPPFPGAGQAPPWPAARTLVGMPGPGFTVPGAHGPPYPPGPAGPNGPHRQNGQNGRYGASPRPGRRWPLLVAAGAVVALVVTGVAVAAPLMAGGGTSSTTTAAPPSDPPVTTEPATPTTTAEEFPRPPSVPGGDPVADEELWDALKGTGVRWSGCEFAESAVETTRSYLLCDATSPSLDQKLGFESYATADEVAVEVQGYADIFEGDPGTCDNGGRFTGALLGRQVACGFFTFDDGTRAYYIVWTKSDSTIFGTAADRDPARVWEWFTTYDPF